jgi:hypothetical protein
MKRYELLDGSLYPACDHGMGTYPPGRYIFYADEVEAELAKKDEEIYTRRELEKIDEERVYNLQVLNKHKDEEIARLRKALEFYKHWLRRGNENQGDYFTK